MEQVVRILLVPLQAAMLAENPDARPCSPPAAELVTHIEPRAPPS